MADDENMQVAGEGTEIQAEEQSVEVTKPEDPQGEDRQAEEAAIETSTDDSQAEELAEPVASEDTAAVVESDEGVGKLSPKQLRKQRKSKFSGEPMSPRSPQERAIERAEVRAKKAQGRRRWRAKSKAKAKKLKADAQSASPVVSSEHLSSGSGKTRQGIVISNKAAKTISVQVAQVRRHPVYKKTVRVSSTLHAHDECNDANPGDVVRIVECRPMSRTKRWRLSEIVERAR